MDRAIGFYEGVLGLRLLRREGRDWAELEAGARSCPSRASSPQGRTREAPRWSCAPPTSPPSRPASPSGVQRGPIEDMGGALTLQFHDPDGNELVALQPPVG